MTDFDMPPRGTWEQRGGWVVRRLMADLHLLDYQAAGIVGNLGFESIGFRTMQEIAPVAGGRGGWGWAQWTGPRRVDFERWAIEEHLPPASDEANYGYLLAELRGDYRSTVAALLKTRTPGEAVFSVGQTYERPGGTTPDHLPGYSSRLEYAKRALAGARSTPAIVTADPVGPAIGDTAAQLDPVELCRRMQRALDVEDDGWPGDDTYQAMRRWRASHPGA